MTATRKTLLVIGFIKELKQYLSKKTIIPDEIIQLCKLFFIIRSKVFIHQCLNYQHSLYSYDLESKQISTFVSCDNTKIPSSADISCYIPNISRIFPVKNSNNSSLDPNKTYDGFIGTTNYRDPYYTASHHHSNN